MDEGTRRQAQAILETCKRAWGQLRGPGTPKQRIGNAKAGFSAYTKSGILSPHVRDVYNAHTLRGIEGALHTLQELAEEFAKPESEPRGE
jgi:hypothetical protein